MKAAGLGSGMITETGDSDCQRNSQSLWACVMAVRVVWAVRARFEWLAWMETVGGVDDKQNCDRERGQDGWRPVFFLNCRGP